MHETSVLFLRDFVSSDGPLTAATKPVDFGAQFGMLGTSASHSFSPVPERTWMHVPSHEFADLIFLQTELKFNGFERGTIFPGHFDQPV